MKKDDIIILSCSVCGEMSHAVKKEPQFNEYGYRLKGEFIICKICFGALK